MSIQQLSAAYQRSVKPLVTLCWATSLGLLAGAGMAALFQEFKAGSVAIGLLGISAFYLLLGFGYLVQDKLSAPATASSEVPAPMSPALKSRPVAAELEADDKVDADREMASV